MDISGLHHIGIVVKSIEQSLPFYQENLGLTYEGIEFNSGANVNIAFLRAGETLIELLEPVGEGSIRNFLETNGEGVHHIAMQVDDVAASLRNLKSKNTPLLDQVPKDGGRGAQIAFLETNTFTSNVTVELIEP